MPKVKTEYEVEKLFIERLCEIGYEYIELKNYDEVLENFREQIALFNNCLLYTSPSPRDTR
mgnify:CR=1 FL=1